LSSKVNGILLCGHSDLRRRFLDIFHTGERPEMSNHIWMFKDEREITIKEL
jgi:hypothetical protein